MAEKNEKYINAAILGVAIFFLISWFSSKSGSVSVRQSNRILLMFNLVTLKDIFYKTSEYYRWSFIIRKGAHFLLFLIFGISMSITFKKDTLSIIIFITFAAIFDEFHQSFRGRGASLSDVLLDIAGGFAGWSSVEVVRYLLYNNEKERED